MKQKNTLVIILFALFAFTNLHAKNTKVTSSTEFATAYSSVLAGDTITLANQVWTDVALVFSGKNGTAALPIRIMSESYGGVIFTGNSSIRFSGSYIIVEGIIFKNAYSTGNGLIEFRSSSSSLATYSRVTRCAFVDCNPELASTNYLWLALYGTYNRVDHCFFKGKMHLGPTMAVVRNGHVADYHQIDSNYFGYRPALGENGGETIRVGTSTYSLSASRTIVEYNYFERCNGEMEIISNKSCENIYRYNTLFECEGTITMRHGNRCEIYGNFIFGNRKSNTGGIRIIGEDHKVYNNYISGTTGNDARSAICLYEGIVITDTTAASQLSSYFPVKRAVIAHNTIVDCKYNLAIGSGRTTTVIVAPSDITFANNVFRGISGNLTSPMITQVDTADNLVWQKNYISGTTLGISPTPSGISTTNPSLSLGTDGFYRPSSSSPLINVALGTYSYVTSDMDGQLRDATKDVGADEYLATAITKRPMNASSAGAGNASIESGNWSDTTKWLYNQIPGSGVDVTISSGDTIYYDAASSTIGNLNIRGNFYFSNSVSARDLTINGSLTIDSGAVCAAPARATTGTELLHTMTIKKNLVNNGVFDMRGGTGTTLGANTCNAVNITFGDITNSNIYTGSYSSSNNEFNGITINKTNGASVNLYGDIFTTTAGTVLAPHINFTSGLVYTGARKFVLLSTGATVSSGSNSSYVVGKFGRSFSSSGGSKSFVVGDSSAFRPVTLHTVSTALTSGHYMLAEVVKQNANNGSSTFSDSIDAVSSVRYFKLTFYQNTSTTTSLTFDYYIISYGADDGITAGVATVRTGLSTTDRTVWRGAGPSNHTTVISSTPTTIQSSTITVNQPVISNNGSLYLSMARKTGGSGLSRSVSITAKIQGLQRENSFQDDSLLIQLRESQTPYAIVHEEKVLSVDNHADFSIGDLAYNGQYYIVVKHRNAIETWSSVPVGFESGMLTYNLTDSPARAYGNNLILIDTSYCLFSGDVNNDGFIDFSDLTMVDNAAYNYVSGYVAVDVNGDMFVDFSDLAIVDNNAYSFTEVNRPERQSLRRPSKRTVLKGEQ